MYIHCLVPTVASADQGQSGQGGGEVGAHLRDPGPDQLQGIDHLYRNGGDTTYPQLNFSYVITEPADGAWGVRTAGGDWSGMIGQLVDREVMLGAAAFAISQASRAGNEGSLKFHNHGEGPY